MQVVLKKLKISHFKGFYKKDVSFELSEFTKIKGDNGLGKTSIFDAFLWLLFGKDSAGRKDFEVIPVDHAGKAVDLHKDSVVTGHFEVTADGKTKKLKLTRINHPNWVTTRGESQANYKGNIIKYEIDDVPSKAGDFADKIERLFGEEIFRLLSNPFYFNELHWEKQRAIIFELAEGTHTYMSVVDKSAEYRSLMERHDIESISTQADMDAIRTKLNAVCKKLKESLDEIPPRIDEVRRSIPEINTTPAEVAKEIETHQKNIERLNNDKAIFRKKISANDSLFAQQQTKYANAKKELEDYKSSVLSSYYESKRQLEGEHESYKESIQAKRNRITVLERSIASEKEDIEFSEKRIKEYREAWESENAKKFEVSMDKTTCGACGQRLPEEDLAKNANDQQKTFNENKERTLKSINDKGIALKQDIENAKKVIEAKEIELSALNKSITELVKSLFDTDKALSKLKSPFPDPKIISKLEKEVEKQSKMPEAPDYSADIKDLDDKIEVHNNSLLNLKDIERHFEAGKRAEQRIVELKEQFEQDGKAKAEVENDLFILDKWERDYVDYTEAIISGNFNFVRFRMFKEQLNGGLAATCEATVNGVPYKSVNDAGKINAGLDIIRALSRHYGIKVPVFVDRAESITKPINTGSQMILLYVSEGHSKLTII